MTAKYTGVLARNGRYQMTGKSWNGKEWVTETLAFEVDINDRNLKDQIWQARSNKSKKSTDGPLTIRFIEKLPNPQGFGPLPAQPLPAKCAEDYCLADGHSAAECPCHCHDVTFAQAQAETVRDGRIDLGQHCGFCQNLLTECACERKA